MRIQAPVKGRKRLYSGVQKEINKSIERLAHKFNCSKSFVSNTLLADAMGIKIQEHFYETNSVESNREVKRTKKVVGLLNFDNRKRAG